MSKHQKKRLCWNCEGNIAIDVETCHYCGVSVVPASLDYNTNQFIPPYQIENRAEEVSIPSSPYVNENQEGSETLLSSADEHEQSIDEFRRALISAALLLSGSVFLMFGIALGLFSQNGVFILQWNGSFWFVYLGLAIPLLLFGWKVFSKISD